MAFRLGHDAGDRIAGIASVAGVARPTPFAPRRPMPIIYFHSVDDPRALYAGGLGPLLPFLTRVFHPPVEETLHIWARFDGCPDEPRVVERRSGRAATEEGAHTATLLVYSDCASGAEVQLWKLTGAGHVWPGAAPRYAERLLGAPTQVIDANELLWRFLSRFRRLDAPALPVPLSSRPASEATATRDRRIEVASGEAERFQALAREHDRAPQLTEQRLYLETLERLLPGLQTHVVEPGKDGKLNLQIVR